MTADRRFAAIALVALLGAVRADAQDADRLAARVDSIFAAHTAPGTPGVSVAIVRDGRILLERGYGLADLEHNVPVTPNTVFDVASVSKQFTGLSVAMLATQGRLTITDDVRKYLPELPDFGAPITIEHLLHHTSGIRDWPLTLGIAGWRFDDVISFDQILRMAYNQRTLNFTPGAEHTYSNTGYNLLAEVVQRVTGKSFRSWTTENLFQPLGMTSTHFHDDHTMIVPDRALGYARVRPTVFRNVGNNLTALGSSSLYSTAHDMAKWLINFDDKKVGGQRAMDLMLSKGKLNNGSTVEYAFGVAHGTQNGQPMFNHSGGWAGFSSFVLVFPQQHFGVVILQTGNTTNVGLAAFTIAGMYLEKEVGAFKPPAPPKIATDPVVPVQFDVLQRYVGWYKLGPAWYVRIRRDGDVLRSLATREQEVALSARGEREFWVAGYNASMGFRDSAGVTYMSYRGRMIPRLALVEQASTRPLSDLAGEYFSEELQTSYFVTVKDTTVTVNHRRHGSITLTRAWGEDFAGQQFLPAVEFQRDASGRVTGLTVNGGERVRNVVFKRRG